MTNLQVTINGTPDKPRVTVALIDHEAITGNGIAEYNPDQHFWRVTVDLQRKDQRGRLEFERRWLMLQADAPGVALRLRDVVSLLTVALNHEA